MGIVGCGKEEKPTGDITMPEDIAPNAESTSEIITDVYWDATYSMQGYTTIQQGNFYRTLPDDLGDLCGSLGEVHFYKFGEQITPLQGREHRQFSNPDAYNEVITAVGNVINQADENHITIIVTDLFESDADWSNVTQKLKEKYFSKHMGVAIIGVKNPFNGDIFDVGLNAAKFQYDSGNDANKYRPFYLFIAGPTGKIETFLAKWRERETFAGMQYVFFSEELSRDAADFSKMEIKGMDNFYSDAKLPIKDKRMVELGVSSADKPAMITASFKYEPPFGACNIDMTKLHTYVGVYVLGEDGWELSDAENDVKCDIAPSSDGDGKYDVTLKLTPEASLMADKINLLHVSAAPEGSGVLLPDWVKSWNMANYDIDANAFDGSKTINFLHVVGSLKDSMLMSAHPSLVNVNIVIDMR